MRFVLADPTQPHQVILKLNQRRKNGVIELYCNCQPKIAIGVVHNIDDTKRLFNNPEAHSDRWIPFTDQFKLTYNDSEDVKK